MSSTIWTPRAVASSASARRVDLWRAVEAQHVASTRRLVDDLGEQQQLEEILERSKPAIPALAATLHYLLGTPFRYPSPFGSRFRAPDDPGVFYGANSVRTACAEVGYWRWRFLTASAGLAVLGPAPQSVFAARVDAPGIDLEAKPFSRDVKIWQNPDDYAGTQQMGRTAREARLGLISYRSVRDSEPGTCSAVLTPEAFRAKKPVAGPQTWWLFVTPNSATWQRDDRAFEFDMTRWAAARS